MPALGTHIIIAEKLLERHPDVHPVATKILSDETLKRAYLFGSWGPDFLYYMVDDKQQLGLFNEFFKAVNDSYGHIQECIELYERIGQVIERVEEPDAALEEFTSDGADADRENFVRLKQAALIKTAEVLVLTDKPITVPNPLANLGIPGVSSAPTIDIGQGLATYYLRTFGHPYSSDSFFKTPGPPATADRDATYGGNWWWVDLLHYRRTGQFAERLLQNAAQMTGRDKDLLEAYALGYWTHVAGDVTGHAYVNTMVGGPYRNHVLRHLVMENVADAWAWDHYKGADLIASKMDRLIRLDLGDAYKVAELLIMTMKEVYTEPAQGDFPDAIRPSLLPNHVPTPLEIYSAYQFGLKLLENGMHQNLTPPRRPPNPDAAGLRQLNTELAASVEASFANAELNAGLVAAAVRGARAPEDIIVGSICGALWCFAGFAQLFLYGPSFVQRLTGMPKRWYYYYLQNALLAYIREMNWLLAQNGSGKVSQHDLSREFCKGCFSLSDKRTGPDAFNHPFLPVDRSRNFFWLSDPADSAAREVREGAKASLPVTPEDGIESSPYPKGASPAIFIDAGFTFDSRPQVAARLRAFATAGTPDQIRALQHATFDGPQFGNAVDFAFLLITRQYPACAFDLDSDLGYGATSWERKAHNDWKVSGTL